MIFLAEAAPIDEAEAAENDDLPVDGIVVTPGLYRLFQAEIRNEKNGGDSPATLLTAQGSLMQMPQDVLHRTTKSRQSRHAVSLEILRLVKKYGRNVLLTNFTTAETAGKEVP